VRRLAPDRCDPVDPAEAYRDPRRRRIGHRPWVIIGMVASVDGATALDGRSGGLGGPGDAQVFSALRAQADVILVGAATVRAERYRAPRRPGQRIAVVSRTGDVDPGTDLFPSGAGIAVVPEDTVVADGIPCIRAGTSSVDLTAALRQLDATVVVAEGGPTLNGQLVAAGLVDEVCATVAPLLVGGLSPRLATGPSVVAPTPLVLAHLLEHDGELFGRWLRRGVGELGQES
jgi:riboflavin biosynthesis pyrimidine reductase